MKSSVSQKLWCSVLYSGLLFAGIHTSTALAQNEADLLSQVSKYASISGKELKLEAEGLPTARVTPEGEIYINNIIVPMTNEQRTLIVNYRKELDQVIQGGVAMGGQAANLGTKALGDLLVGLLSGEEANVEKKIEQHASEIAKEAVKMCPHIETLKTIQSTLSIQLPDLEPYLKNDIVISGCNK